MESTAEILIFEYNEVYGSQVVAAEQGVETFIRTCLDYIPRGTEARFGKTAKTIYYSEGFGGDKPRTVILICSVTDELVQHIKKRIDKEYEACINYE